MFRTGAQLFILTLIVGLFLMREAQREPVLRYEESFADFLAMNARRSEQTAPTTLVQINESSLREHPWPWGPVDYAVFLQSLLGFGPEVIATDEVLGWSRKNLTAEQATKLAQYEQILREQILKAPRVLVGGRLGFPEDPDKLPPLESLPVLRRVAGDVKLVPEFTVVEARTAEDFRLSSTEGFTNLPGENNWHRSVPLVLRYRGQVVPTFALHAMLLWEKVPLDEVSVELGRHVVLGDRVEIPIDALGRMRVDFGVRKEQCAFDDLILAAEQRDAGRPSQVPASFFSGRFVLLSRGTPDARPLRLAAGRRGSTGELFAAAIATVQNRSFIQKAPWWSDLVIIGGFAFVAFWIPRWGKGLTVFVGVVSLLAYTLGALALFGAKLLWISGVIPAGLVLFLVLYRLASPNIDPWSIPPKR
jgi:hypothetical protein